MNHGASLLENFDKNLENVIIIALFLKFLLFPALFIVGTNSIIF